MEALHSKSKCQLEDNEEASTMNDLWFGIRAQITVIGGIPTITFILHTTDTTYIHIYIYIYTQSSRAKFIRTSIRMVTEPPPPRKQKECVNYSQRRYGVVRVPSGEPFAFSAGSGCKAFAAAGACRPRAPASAPAPDNDGSAGDCTVWSKHITVTMPQNDFVNANNKILISYFKFQRWGAWISMRSALNE